MGCNTAEPASSRITRAWVVVDMAERTFHGFGRQLGNLPCQLHSGRTPADNGERQQLLAEGRIAGPVRQLEGAEDTSSNFQRIVDGFHARCELGVWSLPK